MTKKLLALVGIFAIAILVYAQEPKVRINETQAEINRLTTQVNSLQARADALQSQVNSLKSDVNSTKTAANALQAQVTLHANNEAVLALVIAQHHSAIDQLAGHHVALCLTRKPDGGLVESGQCALHP